MGWWADFIAGFRDASAIEKGIQRKREVRTHRVRPGTKQGSWQRGGFLKLGRQKPSGGARETVPWFGPDVPNFDVPWDDFEPEPQHDVLSDTGWIPVTSSNVSAIRWVGTTGAKEALMGENVMYIRFKTGSEYVYFDVSFTFFNSFKRSGSKGKFVVHQIQANFEYREMTNIHKTRRFPENYAGPLGPHNTPL